mmetsp:Transcript_87281/g.270251  ORF Transcript_87281/g.270251 Transcript_87281/m.270251 type:complete len:297 (+) Transcript_87281:33-923(+)
MSCPGQHSRPPPCAAPPSVRGNNHRLTAVRGTQRPPSSLSCGHPQGLQGTRSAPAARGGLAERQEVRAGDGLRRGARLRGRRRGLGGPRAARPRRRVVAGALQSAPGAGEREDHRAGAVPVQAARRGRHPRRKPRHAGLREQGRHAGGTHDGLRLSVAGGVQLVGNLQGVLVLGFWTVQGPPRLHGGVGIPVPHRPDAGQRARRGQRRLHRSGLRRPHRQLLLVLGRREDGRRVCRLAAPLLQTWHRVWRRHLYRRSCPRRPVDGGGGGGAAAAAAVRGGGRADGGGGSCLRRRLW